MAGITKATIEQALKDRGKGTFYDLADGKISGLELRVRPRGVNWSVRTMLHGKRTRFDLGPAVKGNDDVNGLTLDTARARAGQVRQMAHNHIYPEHYLAGLATGVSIETQLRIERERDQERDRQAEVEREAARPAWTWETASSTSSRRSCALAGKTRTATTAAS